ncbi:hypothetical protein R1flu_025145 [Riccia fluitans]|uniref:Secreted protein n=1 Tax=Riccia fluitans TaxID=41844 RepID=A0ABD1Y121_9MARC
MSALLAARWIGCSNGSAQCDSLYILEFFFFFVSRAHRKVLLADFVVLFRAASTAILPVFLRFESKKKRKEEPALQSKTHERESSLPGDRPTGSRSNVSGGAA